MRIKIVTSERNSLTLYDHVRASKWNLNFLLLCLVDKITVQFSEYIKDYPHFLRKRVVSIPNPVYPATLRAQPDIAGDGGRFCVLSVGRLCNQKNYESLLDAFAGLAPAFPDWDLIIVGDGESREQLDDVVERYGLADRVSLPGTSDSMSQWYAAAHLFCLPSRWEGFPNALAEALAHGLPAVGFDGCAGVRHLIAHEENGLLANGNGNVASLKDALKMLMNNAGLRVRMGDVAVERIKQYDPSYVFSLWEHMLSNATEQ